MSDNKGFILGCFYKYAVRSSNALYLEPLSVWWEDVSSLQGSLPGQQQAAVEEVAISFSHRSINKRSNEVWRKSTLIRDL